MVQAYLTDVTHSFYPMYSFLSCAGALHVFRAEFAYASVNTFFQILTRMKDLCYKDNSMPDNMNQQLLKNMGAHDVVLIFLSVPHDKV